MIKIDVRRVVDQLGLKNKRTMLVLQLFAVLWFSNEAHAATITYWLNYQTFRDEYRLDFQWPTGTTNYNVHFESPSGVPYDLPFNNPPTGILYLTCNGTYSVQFFAGGNQVAEYTNIVTTAIVAPTCSSYPDQTGTNGLNAKATDNGNGTFDLKWDAKPGAAKYDIYKDGQKIGETTGTNYTFPGEGAVSVVARDDQGNIIDQSDLHVPDLQGGGEETKGCDGCKFLQDMLACPDWDRYMGELTQAIKSALPTLPEWRQIADQFVDAFADYWGPVPEVPTQAEIDAGLDKTLPDLDAGSDDAEKLVPTVPPGYEQPKPFDITSGPQIEIVDESQPFQIFDPLHNVEFDDPGVMVVPGDSRNNMGGIEKPGILTLPSPTPTPSHQGTPSTDPTPTPSTNPGPGPIPSDQGGPGPIPGGTGGPGPIPDYKG